MSKIKIFASLVGAQQKTDIFISPAITTVAGSEGEGTAQFFEVKGEDVVNKAVNLISTFHHIDYLTRNDSSENWEAELKEFKRQLAAKILEEIS